MLNDIRIDAKDGKFVLVLCGVILITNQEGEIVVPVSSPDLEIPIESRQLVRLASDLAKLGYVRI